MTKNKWSRAALDDLLRSGIIKKEAEKLGMKYHPAEAMNKIIPGANVPAAYEIVHFDLDGKPIDYSRYRFLGLYKPKGAKKPSKYYQPPGSSPRFYFTPFLNWREIAADPSIPIYIVEGEKKAIAMCKLGYAAIGIGGVWNWLAKEDEDLPSESISDFNLIDWRGRVVHIVFDSDAAYKKSVKAAERELRGELIRRGANPHRIEIPYTPGQDKVGVDDLIAGAGGGKKAKKRFDSIKPKPLFLPKSITGEALMQLEIKELEWIIPSVIHIGLTFIAGMPKIGKSWLVLAMIEALISGKKPLGYFDGTEPMYVLYLALEDTELRLQNRLKKIGGGLICNNNRLYFITSWPNVDDDGLLPLERILDQHKNCKIVFIDTFARMRKTPKGKNNIYQEDYEAVAALKKIADDRGIAIVLVHHLRKAGSDDQFERISGSTGITGAADTLMVLVRERNEMNGVLHITGRDIEEQELAVQFNDCVWTVIGKAFEVHSSQARDAIINALKKVDRPLGPTEIAEATGRKKGSLPKILNRMVEDSVITRHEGGKYTLNKEKLEAIEKLRMKVMGKLQEGSGQKESE